MGAHDGGGGLMCFSPETLSSSEGNTLSTKPRKRDKKKKPTVSCSVCTFGRRSAPQSGGGLLKSPLLCLGTTSPLSRLPRVKGATGYTCIYIFFFFCFITCQLAPGLSPLQRKMHKVSLRSLTACIHGKVPPEMKEETAR